ncbi:MAG: hypothetical protein WC943_00735 [Elusimicrobiota bacterium]|jgi:hypothetical protein
MVLHARKFVRLVCTSILAIAFALVNASAASKIRDSSSTSSHPLILRSFINKVLNEGEDNRLGPNLSRVLGLDANHNSKVFERIEDQCADGRYRTANVLFEIDSSTGVLKPLELILLSQRTQSGAIESDWLRINPDGSIKKALRNSGRLTPEGRGVAGSAIQMPFEGDDAKRLLKRELDFWLKGVGLKKKAKDARPPVDNPPK